MGQLSDCARAVYLGVCVHPRGSFLLVGGFETGRNLRANRVPLSQFSGVVGQDDEPFLLGRHCASCGCECAGGSGGCEEGGFY